MLACPPTQLSLTAADVAEFELRFAANQAFRLSQADNARLRLRLGAGHLTKLGFVPAHANTGRKRAESCSSQATVCTDDAVSSQGENPPPAEALTAGALGDSGPTELDVKSQAHSPKAEYPQEADVGIRTDSVNSDTQSAWPLPEKIVLQELDRDNMHNSRHLPMRLRAPSVNMDPDLAFVTSRTWLNSAPEPSIIGDLQNASLDPGAPVFVPRTRFGSTTSLSTESGQANISTSVQSSLTNTMNSLATLRVRSSFERNSQYVSASQDQQDSSIGVTITTGPSQGYSTVGRNDQNSRIPRPALNVDRYPIATAPRNISGSSGSQRQVAWPRRRSSRQHLIEFERSRQQQVAAMPLNPQTSAQSAYLAAPIVPNRRSVSPALSINSHSTPNLFHAATASRMLDRSSSLSWRGDTLRSPLAATEALEQVEAGRNAKSRAQGGQAFEQQWLNRDSPLDELTQQLDRLTARPRSVGRSFERPPGQYSRPSLLTGDPFQMDRSIPQHRNHTHSESTNMPDVRHPSSPDEHHRQSPGTVFSNVQKAHPQALESAELGSEDPVALALALPSPTLHLSPSTRGLQGLPSTPLVGPPDLSQMHTVHSEHPPSPTLQPSSASATPSSLSLSAAATPARFAVYDDSKPPDTQPKTPADLMRTARRMRSRSETASVWHITTRRAAYTPSRVTAAGSAHRRTYPTASTPPQIPAVSPIEPSPPDRSSESATRRHNVSIHAAQRSNGYGENDIEGNLNGLEEDRRTWMRRRGDGTLDITPPREGRFERYLS